MAGRIHRPLVWIDCEDTIMSMCCIITDGDLNVIDQQGYDAVVHHDKEVLDNMNEWCVRTHGQSGLTAACLQSSTTAEDAAQGLLEYIKKYVPESGSGLLAGNSVHCDKEFLSRAPYDRVIRFLSYRILDVSSIKEAAKRWSDPEILRARPVKKELHEARADILESIEEARFYQNAIFRPATLKTSQVAEAN